MQLVVLLVSHPILSAFFHLPASRYTRQQKVMIIYIMVLIQFYGQLLFWGTDNESPFAMVWAFVIDGMLVLVSELVTSAIFALAFLKRLKTEPEPGADEEETHPDDDPSWEILCRQTALPRTSAPLDQFLPWRYHMLLGAVKKSEQFCSDKLHDAQEFRSQKGSLVCKLVYSRRSWCKYRPQVVIRWAQSSALSDDVVKDFKATRGFDVPPGFTGLKKCMAIPVGAGGALEVSEDGLIFARPGFDFVDSSATCNQVALYQGGSAGNTPIFLVAQAAPSDVGALTGQDAHTVYHQVELYLMQSGADRAHRSSIKRKHTVHLTCSGSLKAMRRGSSSSSL